MSRSDRAWPRTKIFLRDSVRAQIRKTLAPYRPNPFSAARGRLGFCYVRAWFGVLKIDVGLLLLTAYMKLHPESVRTIDGEDTVEGEFTEEVVEVAEIMLRLIPSYFVSILLPLFREARADYVIAQEHPSLTMAKMTEKLCQPETAPAGRRLLRMILRDLGPNALEFPNVRYAFKLLFAGKENLDSGKWEKILNQCLPERCRRGRPRKAEYDEAFRMREFDPKSATYGKLTRLFSQSQVVDNPYLLAKRIQAAVSYRKRKARAAS